MMRHGSLFSGIGGFDLAAEWMGWENVFHCENNKFCQKVLKYYWPNSILYEDITATYFNEWRGKIDIITGGFPCQPFSVAGDRKGQEDDRFLWKEMLRAITEVKPRWVVAENVYGLLNIDYGATADLVCSDLENCGYEKPIIFDCAANQFGLPTMERHIWFISEATSQRCQRGKNFTNQDKRNERKFQGANKGVNYRRDISKTRFCNVGERISRKLVADQRNGLAALGNAIVPQVAYEIFKAIEAMNPYTNKQ